MCGCTKRGLDTIIFYELAWNDGRLVEFHDDDAGEEPGTAYARARAMQRTDGGTMRTRRLRVVPA